MRTSTMYWAGGLLLVVLRKEKRDDLVGGVEG